MQTTENGVWKFNFAWWNVHNFSHFVAGQKGEERWPISEKAYEEKCRRVDCAVREAICSKSKVHLLGLAEVTTTAACGLRERVFPSYEVFSLDNKREPHQVAVIYDQSLPFETQSPVSVPNVPRTTRVMPVVDLVLRHHRIRFIFCHWTAFDTEG